MSDGRLGRLFQGLDVVMTPLRLRSGLDYLGAAVLGPRATQTAAAVVDRWVACLVAWLFSLD